MSAVEVISILLILSGCVFFAAGTVGLLRFPDLFTRLHALTKGDNLGLGLVVLGLSLNAETWIEAAKLLLIWVLTMIAAATSCHLIARAALSAGLRPWTRR